MFNYNMACMEWVIVMSKDNFPGPGDLEKELNDYLIKKYGNIKELDKNAGAREQVR